MSTPGDQPNNNTRGALRLAPSVEEMEEYKGRLPRQFVNFTFYRARPEWRMLDEDEKTRCKESFVKAIDDFRRHLLIHTYSTVGLRTSADFMIWRIGHDLDPIQEMTGCLNGTSMAKYVEPTQSFISMTKTLDDIEKDCGGSHRGPPAIVPGKPHYLFICPLEDARMVLASQNSARK